MTDERAASSASAAPRRWLAPAALVATIFLAYAPALSGGLLWDDAAHVTKAELQSLSGLLRIWSEPGATQQYYPLLHSAFWVEHRLWGDSLLGHHLVNVALHATAALLLLGLLRRLDVRGALLASAVFALHPVMVESVAWISELKNTLSATFYLLAAHAWLTFDASRRPRHWTLATLLFVLGLLTKTVIATLPAALLVVQWWRRGRLPARRDVAPLVPWLVLGAAAGATTAWIERTVIGAQGEAYAMSVVQRLLLASRAPWFYASKLVWPADLVFIYPRWTIDPAVAWQWAFPVASLAAAGVLVLVARRRPTRAGRAWLAGLLFFVGTLFPALGFLNVFPFVYSFVADHFQYLASLGVIVPACAGLAVLSERLPARAAAGLGCALVLLLGVLTWRQSRDYADAKVLYRATIDASPSCWMAWNNLGSILGAEGALPEAVDAYEGALRARPEYPNAHFNLARVLVGMGRFEEAIVHFREVRRLRPLYKTLDERMSEALDGLGLQLAKEGRHAESLAAHREAVSIDAKSAAARCDLGVALLRAGAAGEALAELEEALRLRPDYAEALNNLAWILATDPGHCDPARAVALAEKAVALVDAPGPDLLDTLAAAREGRCLVIR